MVCRGSTSSLWEVKCDVKRAHGCVVRVGLGAGFVVRHVRLNSRRLMLSINS